jgi:hypothetical protein
MAIAQILVTSFARLVPNMASDFVAPDYVLPLLAQSFPESQATPIGGGQPSLLLERVSPFAWRSVVTLSLLRIFKDISYRSLLDQCICGCGGGACIPQREYQRQNTGPLPQLDLPEMILFNVNGKCGYPLTDALMERYSGLKGGDDKMFVDLRSSSIAMRLEVRLAEWAGSGGSLKSYLQWLPYKGWTRQVGVDSRICCM